MLALADRVMVMKGGLSQGELDVSKVGLDDIVSLIVKGRADGAQPLDEVRILSV